MFAKRSRPVLGSSQTSAITACALVLLSGVVFHTTLRIHAPHHPIPESSLTGAKKGHVPPSLPIQVTIQGKLLSDTPVRAEHKLMQTDAEGAVVVSQQAAQQERFGEDSDQELTDYESRDANDRPSCEQGQVLTDDGKPCQKFEQEIKNQLIYYVEKEGTQYLVCPIPKNGCTYHLGLMYRVGGEKEKDYGIVGKVHGLDIKQRYRLSSQPASRAAELLLDERIPKYVVTRNPMHRTLSAYLDKIERHYSEDEKTPEAFRKWVYEEFRKGRDSNWTRTDAHWRPQTEFCGYKQSGIHEKFTKFREEKPEEYVDFLYKTVPKNVLDDGWGVENKSFRDFVLGPRARTGNTSEKAKRYFNVKVLDFLGNILQEDIERLGYEDEVAELRKQLEMRQR